MQGHEGQQEGQHPTYGRGTGAGRKAARAEARKATSSTTKAVETVRTDHRRSDCPPGAR